MLPDELAITEANIMVSKIEHLRSKLSSQLEKELPSRLRRDSDSDVVNFLRGELLSVKGELAEFEGQSRYILSLVRSLQRGGKKNEEVE